MAALAEGSKKWIAHQQAMHLPEKYLYLAAPMREPIKEAETAKWAFQWETRLSEVIIFDLDPVHWNQRRRRRRRRWRRQLVAPSNFIIDTLYSSEEQPLKPADWCWQMNWNELLVYTMAPLCVACACCLLMEKSIICSWQIDSSSSILANF